MFDANFRFAVNGAEVTGWPAAIIMIGSAVLVWLAARWIKRQIKSLWQDG